MGEPATLISMLRDRAAQHRERTALVFLLDGEQEGESLTYAALDAWARRSRGCWRDCEGSGRFCSFRRGWTLSPRTSGACTRG